MAYSLSYTSSAEKQLSKLTPKQQKRIIAWIEANLENCQDPYAISSYKALVGHKGAARYWVGDFRIAVLIRDKELIVEIFRISHRKDVYRNL